MRLLTLLTEDKMAHNAFKCGICYKVTRHVSASALEYETITTPESAIKGTVTGLLSELGGFLGGKMLVKIWKCCECGAVCKRWANGNLNGSYFPGKNE